MIIAAIVAMALSFTTPTVKVLDNGVTVIVQPIPNSRTYSMQLFVRAGSAHQQPGEEGVFHLIEHLVFRSSDAQYRAEMSGSWMNATTYREFTRFIATGPSESWREGLQNLVKLIGSAREISFEALVTETRVVIEEIALQDLDSESAMDRALWKAAYPNSTWSMRTSGERDFIERISRDSIEAAIAKHYTGANMVIVAAGHLRMEEVLAECERLAGFPPGERSNIPLIPEIVPERSVSKTPDGIARVGFGFAAPGINNANYPAFRIAMEALAGRYGLLADAGLRTIMFFGPSEKASLATLVLSGKDEAEDIEKSALQTLRAAATSLTELHFSSAKAIVLSEIRAASKIPDRAAFRIGIGTIFGKPDFFSSEVEAIEHVTIESVKQALEALQPERATVIVWSKT